jgi:ElaB/YqjD/DUF883 family membrane-anchored ribosome-binding protein
MYTARRAARAGDRAAREHPYAAIGIAGGVRLLFGLLFLRH